MFVLLFTLPLIGFSQNIYNEDDVKFNQDSSLVLLKSNDTPVSGIVKKTCKQKGMIFKIRTNCEYVIKNGLFISSKGYYKNNQISQETQRNGICKFYYKNGVIKYTGNMVEGWYDGVWKYFDKKGVLETEEIWEDGELITEKDYEKNGSLWREMEWTSDNSGIFKLYDGGLGLVIKEGTLKNGKKEGVWKYYTVNYEDGTKKLDKKIIFKNGKKVRK
ncbi:MAG: hypothetical protein VYD59_02425 [Bacteroidota bacterium]|nr:hypothetical protein [Bacteroidota bacterium]